MFLKEYIRERVLVLTECEVCYKYEVLSKKCSAFEIRQSWETEKATTLLESPTWVLQIQTEIVYRSEQFRTRFVYPENSGGCSLRYALSVL